MSSYYNRWYYRPLNITGGSWKPLSRGISDDIEQDLESCKKTNSTVSRKLNNYLCGVNSTYIDFAKMQIYEHTNSKTHDDAKTNIPIGELQRKEELIDYQWFWQDTKGSNNTWIPLTHYDNVAIEDEYRLEQEGKNSGLVFHCFGDKGSTLVNFKKMKTLCGSGRCPCYRDNSANPLRHNEFAIKRIQQQNSTQ